MSTFLTLIEPSRLNAHYREKLYQNMTTSFQVIVIFIIEKNTNYISESQRSRSNVNNI